MGLESFVNSISELWVRFSICSVQTLEQEIFEVREPQPGKPGIVHECLRPTYLLLRAQTGLAALAPSVRRSKYYA